LSRVKTLVTKKQRQATKSGKKTYRKTSRSDRLELKKIKKNPQLSPRAFGCTTQSVGAKLARDGNLKTAIASKG